MVIIYSFISTGRFSFVEVAQINGNIAMGVKMFGNRGWFDFHWGFIYAIIIKKEPYTPGLR
jgi:hypothetical protein